MPIPKIPQTPDDKPPFSLKMTMLLSVVVGFAALVVVMLFYPYPPMVFGVLSGLVLGVANYVFMLKLIERLLKPGGKKVVVAVLLGLKMLFLLTLVAVAFWVLKVHPMAFVAGYMSLILVLTLQSLFSSLRH